MTDELSRKAPISRRRFVGGLTSLAAASAFSLAVADETAAQVTDGDDATTQTLTSPDGSVEVTVTVADGVPHYSVAYGDTAVVDESALGFEFEDQPAFGEEITVTGSERSTVDETWTPVWDQYDEISEHYEELRVGLREASSPGRSLTLEFRAFDDGVGFRYVFPENSGFGEFAIGSERTEFAFADDYTSWWIQSDFNSYEYAYNETPLSDIGSESPTGGAHTPMTMRTDDGLYASVHEANLVDYAAMAVSPTEGTTFESSLAPLPNGTKVRASAPHRTPWRTIQVGDRPGALVESNLIVNLNDPRDPADFPKGTDWIEPQKFIGVWWLMITGRADWEYMGPETGNHGAQTKRMKRYMDFASEHSIPSVLVEGWNEGWSTYPGDGSAMDFDDPYPDFDWEEVVDYGEGLDSPVAMTAHNETAGNITNYESQLRNDPNPFADYEDRGIRSIKTGYVADSGVTIDGTTYNHHCQPLVNHHHLVYRKAANHRQMLEVHEPIHPTGERRTYPNVMTREGVLGQEYDSFGYVDPSHHVTFPFTRMLGGPVEYTPGIFDMDSGSGGIETTRAKQLAMYPTYFSGLQMAADLPSSYLADQPATLGVGEVTQAEFGEVEGFPTAAKWAGAQGERYVAIDPNNADTGATVSWTIEADTAGEYDLYLRYASDAEDNAVPAETPRTATVVVNGEETKITAPPTPYWDEWSFVSTTVSLDAGENAIALVLTGDDTGGFNLDSIAVREGVVGVGEVVQAEAGAIEGFVTASKWANAQGGAYVPVDPNRADTGARVSWTIEADTAGEYDLHLRYASDAEDNAVPAETPRTATVVVNGERTQATVPPTEYWDDWGTVSTTVSLDAGENAIALVLTGDDTGGFNLDSLAATETGASLPALPTVPATAPIRGPTVEEFQFIEDVPAAGWDDTRVLDAAIGEYMLTARKKDGEWYVGAMTDENGRALDVPLEFLAAGRGPPDDAGPPEDAGPPAGAGPPESAGPPARAGPSGGGNGRGPPEGSGPPDGAGPPDNAGPPGNANPPHAVPDGPKYVAEIYTDGIDAAYDTNLSAVSVESAIVTPRTTLLASMVGSGGTAVRLHEASEEEIAELPTYEYPTQDVEVSIAGEVFVNEPFITATGSNATDYIGGTTVELLVDDETVASANVRIPPNSSGEEYTLPSTIDDPGTYDVTVQTTGGETLASETVTIKPPATVADVADPTGDDAGPGGYTYPTADAFRAGAFDLRSLLVEQTPSIYEFTFEVGNLYNAFGSSRGFSPQMFVLWVRDPDKSGGSTTSLDDLDATVDFEQPWHYRLQVSGFTKGLVDSAGAPVTDDEGNAVSLRDTVDTSAGTVTLSLNRAAFDGADAADLEVVAMVQSEDRGTLRPVAEQRQAYVFGGAKSSATDTAPRVMDIITPDGVSQSTALAYSADERATIPFRSL